MNNRECILYLYEEKQISRKKIYTLVQMNITCIYEAIVKQHPIIMNTLGKTLSISIGQDMMKNKQGFQKKLAQRSYKTWTILDQDYPNVLRMIPDPPVVLYGLGNEKLLTNINKVSVIGSRQPTVHTPKRMDLLLLPIIDEFVVVSGLAKGVDGLAHQMAVSQGGKTIAIIGSGFNYPYPYEHRELFKQIASEHLVISEYPPEKRPERYHFPERNRLISALSFATLIIEAKRKSGTMITADQALEQGRIVMAVPGDILNPNTVGCHDLIQQGAKLVQNTQDIMEEWHENKQNWESIN